MSAKKPKLLIISSYKRPCGIAQYLEHLEIPLRAQEVFDVEIAALPVDLLRAGSKHAHVASNHTMMQIAEQARAADVVNIQLELGLLGASPRIIWKRLNLILSASSKVILTYHTVPPLNGAHFSIFNVRSWLHVARAWRSNYVFRQLFSKISAKPDKFFHIVQTAREAKNFEILGFPKETIGNRPLSFLSDLQREQFKSERDENQRQIKQEYRISGKILGCFGFLSSYKGIEIAIRALNYIPEDCHLLVVGGLHPEGIEHGNAEQDYINTLLEEIEVKDHENPLEAILVDRNSVQEGNPKKKRRTSRKAENLIDRVHFMGSPDNEEFNRLMSACDAVILPYAEVGQTSSGPAAIALDMQLPIYCARTHCFRELDKYQPGILSFFEIGNHIELAEKIRLAEGEKENRVKARACYIGKNNVQERAGLYMQAFKNLYRG